LNPIYTYIHFLLITARVAVCIEKLNPWNKLTFLAL